MLAFSEFEFIVKYFFVVLSALILIGLFNGLMLLPVLLSLIGPPCEIRLFDEKAHLPVPAPFSKQQKRGLSDTRTDDHVKRRVSGAFVEMQVNGCTETNAENNDAHHNSSSSVTKESPHVGPEINVKTTSAKIPISTIGRQHSTAPLLSSDDTSNSSSVKRNSDGNSKLSKFSSNALRF
ncbi:unnamed protein product [Onchocerca flexuosa]|uniref:SSD domain-containing protein n=1 Tax=Onchocerca flexuosa TaxID=387005 RepID=A0A183H9W2_9BILA|nr:unnamed protein product [Onchocerca flexuosa]